MINRRGLITGLISLAAAPAIVRASSIMLVKIINPTITLEEYTNLVLKPMIDDLVKRIELDMVYGSGGFCVESVNDSINITPVHDYLKLDQSVSSKGVDPIKIIDVKDYEV